MKNTIYYIIFNNLFLMPFFVFAQSLGNPRSIDDIVTTVGSTFNLYIIPALFVLATLIFIWGVIKYIAKSDDEKARAQAKGLMLWGIIGLVIITAVWSIVAILISYFGVGNSSGLIIPPKQ